MCVNWIFNWIFNCWIFNCWIFNCCSKNYIPTEEDIKEEALILLNEWKVKCYANNKFLHKIPEERSLKKYNEICSQIRNNFIKNNIFE